MKSSEQLSALIDAYIELAQNHNYNDSQIIDSLTDIFDEKDLVELGFGNFVHDYFHDEDEEQQEVSVNARRLEKISAYRDNARILMDPSQRQRLEEVEGLVAEIQRLRPRIEELLAVVNACLENGIKIDMAYDNEYPNRRSLDGYEDGVFVSNDYSPRVGFIRTWGRFDKGPHVFKEVGIVNHEAGDFYDFRTDGETVQFVCTEGNKTEIKGPSHKVEDLRLFLSTFDKFESSFYAYVDKVIEEQQRSVDAILADAQGRSALSQGESGKNDVERAFD